MKAYKCDVCKGYGDGEPFVFGGFKQTKKGKLVHAEELKEYANVEICGHCVGEMVHLLKKLERGKEPETAEQDKSDKPAKPAKQEKPEKKRKPAIINEDFEAAVQDMIDQTESKPKKRRIDKGKLLALKKAGWSNKEIADELGTSPGTVATYVSTLKRAGGSK